MTVTVLRPHPDFRYTSNVTTTGLYAMLPFEIDVAKPEPRGNYESHCKCTEVMRLTVDSVSWLAKHGVLSERLRQSVAEGTNPCICSCMTEVRNVKGKPGRPRVGDRQSARMYGP